MHVIHQERVIIIHIPKTGGTSVSVAAGCGDTGYSRIAHITPAVAKRYFFQNDWDHFFSFTIVRNPWLRYLSLYKYQRSSFYGKLTDQNLSYRLASSLSFEEWCGYNIDATDKSRWFGVPQSEWWKDVTQVYRMESDLEQIEVDLARRLRRPVSIPHLNRSNGILPKMPSRLISFVGTIDHETIEKFEYRNPANL